ncbi:hypothetical protein Ddye_027274 [Dipteronia dyeriana]|uniref:Reverse transcriptase zinc-binding domain-containing protein n=1 Tax=Dipteronia dyeriana TaxID=168575 RepID=A0AAD9WQ13_9ROSI|nr:hypothetical protein Ddye_027274 [Dipteronia dyeriana]
MGRINGDKMIYVMANGDEKRGGDWSISLCNVVYKIVTKTLANWFRKGSFETFERSVPGGLLPPYLFLLCAEWSSGLIFSGVRKRDFKGFRCNSGGPKILVGEKHRLHWCSWKKLHVSKDTSGGNSWWKFLWRLKVPSKGQAVNLASLPQLDPFSGKLGETRGRTVGGDVLCPVCHRQAETSLHALWTCPALKKIRSMCPFMQAIKVHDGPLFGDFMLACVDQLLSYELDLMCVVLRRLWYCRNGVVHNSATLSVDNGFPWAVTFLEGFRILTDTSYIEDESC